MRNVIFACFTLSLTSFAFAQNMGLRKSAGAPVPSAAPATQVPAPPTKMQRSNAAELPDTPTQMQRANPAVPAQPRAAKSGTGILMKGDPRVIISEPRQPGKVDRWKNDGLTGTRADLQPPQVRNIPPCYNCVGSTSVPGVVSPLQTDRAADVHKNANQPGMPPTSIR